MRLKLLRTALNREQREVAKTAGYNVNTVSGIESGRAKAARADTLAAIAGALGVSVDALHDDAACIRELIRITGVRTEDLYPAARTVGQEDDRPVTHRELREILRAELHRMGEPRAEAMGEDAEERQ